MAEEPKRPDYLKPVEADKSYTPPPDAIDIDSLWLDPKLGDGLVDVHFHVIPVDKPKDFFRINPDPTFRRLTRSTLTSPKVRSMSRPTSSLRKCGVQSKKHGAARW